MVTWKGGLFDASMANTISRIVNEGGFGIYETTKVGSAWVWPDDQCAPDYNKIRHTR